MSCRSCGAEGPHACPGPFAGQKASKPLSPGPLSIEDIAAALMQHSADAFAARNDGRATRLRDIADELLGKDGRAARTNHDS